MNVGTGAVTAETRAEAIVNEWARTSPSIPGGRVDAARTIAAALVAAEQATVKRCAKVCDEKADEYRTVYNKHRADAMLQRFIGGKELGADECAEAIRALLPAAATHPRPAADGGGGQ